MVKKTDKHNIGTPELEDLDMSMDLDDGLQVEDDRDPVTKVATGFLDGVKESITDPNIIRRAVLDALPKEYSEAYQVVDSAANAGSGLYHQLAKDMKPAVRDFKRAVKGVRGSLDPLLPKVLADKLDNWLKSDDNPLRRTELNAQEAGLNAELAGIFKEQLNAQEESRAAQMVGEQLQTQRHKTNVELLDDIRRNLSQMVAYQDSITIGYQRKSLELQFRQYYTARDHLQLATASTSEQLSLLRAIAKNSGLPDQVKVRGSEILGQLMQENLYGKVQESMVQTTSGFMRQLFNNVTNRAKEFAGGVRDGLGGATEMLEYGSMVDPDEVDKYQMGGQLAGGEVGKWLANKAGQWFKGSKTGQSDKVKLWGNRLGRYSQSLPDEAQRWAKSPTDSFGMAGDAVDFFKSLIPTGPRKQSIGADSLENSTAPASWDRLQRRTLVEIIPGYLARLLQSSERNRLQTDDVELVKFDQVRQEFAGAGAAGSRILKKILPDYHLDAISSQSNRFIEKILGDVKDPELKQQLQNELLTRAMSNKGFDPADFTNANAYKTLDKSTAKKAAALFENAFNREGDTTESSLTEATDLYRRLRQTMPMIENQTSAFANTGSRDLLRQMGIVTQSGGRDVVDDKFIAALMKDYIGSNGDYEQTVGRASSSSPSLSGDNGVRSSDVYRRTGVSSSYGPTVQGTTVGGQPTSASERFDYERLTTEVDRIVESVKAESTKEQAESALTVLGAILEAINTLELRGGGGYDPSNDQAIIRKSTILRAGGKVASGLWGASKRLYNAGAWARNKVFSGALGAVKAGGTVLSDGFSWLRRNVVADVYTPGDLSLPKLVGYKMRAGQYVDAITGKPVKTVKDIKGAVKDIETGDIVLSLEDFKAGIVDSKGGKLVTNAVGYAMDKLGWAGKLLGKTTWQSMTLPFKVASAANWARRHILMRPTDVYVPGERTPRLVATLLLNGGYFSAKTGKPISSIGDIDSDVVNRDGEVKLTLEEFAAGVVDSKGKPIKTVAGKIKGALDAAWNLGTGVLKFGARQVGRGFKAVGKVATGAAKLLTGMAPNIHFGGKFGQGNDAQHAVLIKIHNLLCRHFNDGEEIPEDGSPLGGSGLGTTKKFGAAARRAKDKVTDVAESVTTKLRSVFASALGKDESELDGKETMWERMRNRAKIFRSGSAADLQAKRAAKAGSVVQPNKDGKPEKSEGFAGKILGLVAVVAGLMKGAVGQLTSLVSGFLGLRKAILALSAAKAGVDLADALGGVDVEGPDGKQRKGGRGGRIKGAIRGAFSRQGLKTAATWGARAAVVGGGTLLSGTASAAGMVMSAAATGIAALFSAPVLIAGGIALAGYGAYKGYQHLKGSVGPLSRARYAQYGIDPDDNTQCRLVMEFEEGLKPYVTFQGSQANIEGKIDYTQWLEHFGFDPNAASHVEEWGRWYQYRFKPVYLRWLKLIQLTQPNADLMDLDDSMKDELKAEFVRKTKFSRTDITPYPYEITVIPFLGQSAPPDTKVIDAEIQAVWDAFKDDIKASQPGATLVNTVAGKTTVASELGSTPKALGSSKSVKTAGGLQYIAEGQMDASPALKKTSGVGDFSFGRSRTIDDLSALRLKTYGLTDLDVMKVNVLLDLEDTVIKELQILPSGQASFDQLPSKYYEEFAGKFGLASTDVEQQAVWQLWFSQRFVPVLLNYVAAIRKEDKTVPFASVSMKLSKAALVNIAEAVRSTKTEIQGKSVSVWSVNASPFVNYLINLDSSSVRTNYQSLENQLTAMKYKDPTPFNASQKATGKGGVAEKTTGFTLPNVSGAQLPVTQAQREAAAPKPKYQNLVSSTPKMLSGSGNGGTGTYAEIPKPKGNGSWEAMKDTLIASALAVGVDPGLLSAMAMIESTFRSDVVAPGTNATGLMQFLPGTWRDMMKMYADRYGVPKDAQPTDPVASALFGASYIKWNMDQIQPKVNRPLTATDMYAAHFLGHANVVKLMKADPNAVAADVFPKQARSNPNVFYSAGRAITIGELYQWMDRKVSGNIPAQFAGGETKHGGDVLAANGLADPNKSVGKVGGLEEGEVSKAPSNALKSASTLPAVTLNSTYGASANRPQAAPVTSSAVTPSTGSRGPILTPAETQQAMATKRELRGQQLQAQQTELAQHAAARTANSVELLKASLEVQTKMDGKLGNIVKSVEAVVLHLQKNGDTPKPKPETGSVIAKAAPTSRPSEFPVNLQRRV